MDHASVVPKVAYQILYDITGHFSTEKLLGTGAFGKVYLGMYEDGKKMAVKLINSYTGFNDEQFQNEFKYLSLLEHQNIVRLIGYCQEIQEKLVRHRGQWLPQDEMQRALCLEYMPNKSLDKYISVECNKLDWYTVYAIIEGICMGLKYLHEELESPIYHLDLKPANILLDENMTAKIADFGLSRLFGEERTRISQNFKGTLGYLPPEYLEKNEISNKLDIFSFGVIVLKVLAGPEGHTKSTEMSSQQFIEHVHENWTSKLQETPVDALKLESYYKQIRKCAEIALSCVQADRHKRPTIGGIVNALNGIKTMTQFSDMSLNSPGSSMNQGNSNSPRKLAFHLLEEMTNNFSEERKLGSGAFAEVYMGVHKDGAKIAVKMLYPTLGLDDEKFEKEYGNLAHLQHPNIVHLVGYCHETQREYVELNGKMVLAEATHRALCFEYMQNGSLDKWLSDEFNGHDWYARYRIIKGICKGLEYLHDELKPPILHMDLKPANILLDEDMLPKVADFGLSRLFGEEQTRITLSSTGTPGYLPPEYIRHSLISKKMDIFSLGVVIIQIMTGPTGYSKVSEMSSHKFIELVHENWRNRLEAKLVDALESYCEQVKMCIQIALRCVEVDRHKRPTIGDIVKNLNATEIMIEFRNELQNDEWSSGVQNDSGTPMDQDVNTMNYESVVPRSLAYHLLEEMTNGFSPERKIGSGAFGEVYKATYKNGEMIAVKVLRNMPGLDDAQFEQEYGHLQNLRHQNIVRVVGYCNETRREYLPFNGRNVLADITHIAICLEYMPNGSLDNYLCDGTTGLDWQTRYDIIKGICKGLKYLHEDLESPIYHLDLKPANVLLDENMIPKISDFGLSRLLEGEATQITTSSIGTYGYIPPEYIERHVISNKFDIFSLGVIILKIVAGTEGYFRSSEVSSEQFIETEVGNWRKLFAALGCLLESYSEQVQRCLEIAFKCLENDRHKRPSIGDIIHMLNKDVNTMNNEGVVPRSLAYHLLEEMTNGFSPERKIGSGAFGEVYKGIPKNGEMIAVKVLRNMPGLDDSQFEQEYGHLQNLGHQNIVRVVGYCHETRREYVPYNGRNVLADLTHIAICFEYMPNGSLDNYLCGENTGHNWQTRYAIIKGICNGLKYLHEELKPPIYHLDLKPANVLLDKNLLPKITDFGLSRHLDGETTHITRSSVGTLGYLPPEYINSNVISNKFDIFSLGVVIIKIMTGPMGYSTSIEMSSQQFIETVVRNWRNRLHAASEPMMEVYCEQVKRCLEIALNCLKNDRHERPSIGDIISKFDKLDYE